MSWKDKLENGVFSILTGDGVTFYPLWKLDANKQIEYNSTTFEFIDQPGSHVDRRLPKASKYDIAIYFQGENCNEDADSFEESARDPRYWTIEHPIYGTIKGQPTGMSRSDSTINVVSFDIEFWESILEEKLIPIVRPKDEITIKQIQLDKACLVNFDLKADVKPSNQNKTRDFLNFINSEYKKDLTNKDYNGYQLLLSNANKSIDNMIIKPGISISSINTVINSKKNSDLNIFKKIESLKNLFNFLKKDFTSKSSSTTDYDRLFFESTGSSVLSTMSEVLLNPNPGDYNSRSDINRASRELDEMYSDYFNQLNEFEAGRNNTNNNFNSSFEIQSQLNLIVKTTLYDLFSSSFDYKQERSFELNYDSNLIVLTHKYLGLDSEDENLETFRKINNIKNNKVFIIKKGTKIKYFV